MQEVLYARYYTIHENEEKKYLIQTRYQAKNSGTFVLKVHCIDKGVDPNVRPEKQILKPVVTPSSSST